MYRIILLGLLTAVTTGCAHSQERATTESGRTVILYPDSTWEYAEAPDSPDSLNVYFGNLHSHTSYSDGSGTPEEAYTYARDVAGLDFLAITEHNHSEAGRIAQDESLYSGSDPTSLISTANRFTDSRFVAIYGQEFSSIRSGNHANVLEVGEVIRTSDVANGAWDLLLNDWLPSHLDSQGEPALILLNHPSASGSPDDREYGIDDFEDVDAWRSALDVHAQLFNIVNGPSHDQPTPGNPSEWEFLRYLDLGLHVGPTADQDNHRPNWGTAAETRTGVIAPARTKAAILEALRNRHVYATEDRNLKVIFTINGALSGTRLQVDDVPAPGSDLDLVVRLEDADEPLALYIVDVYSDQVGGIERADVVRQFTAIGDTTLSLSGVKYEGGAQYVFIKVTQTDDDAVEVDRAWVAPVWFEPAGDPSPGAVLTLDVNEALETATITNVGGQDINLREWRLRSVQGGQEYTFAMDLVLTPGLSVVVTSGRNARENLPQVVLWTTSNIWNNSGDPGQLFDPQGELRAETH